MMNAQDKRIQKWFDNHKDTHPTNTTLVHQLAKMDVDGKYPMDKFVIQLGNESFDYYQGVGHRVSKKQWQKKSRYRI